MAKEYVEVTVELKAATGAAVLVSDGAVEVWLPLSEIENTEELDDVSRGDVLVLNVAYWLAHKEGLI